MEESINSKCEIIAQLIDEIINLIISERGYNSFGDLEKAKKIMCKKNANQLKLVLKKLDNFTMMFYNQNFFNDKKIIEKLNQIYLILGIQV